MELSLENILNEVDKIPGGLAKGKTLDDIAKKHNVEKDELKKQLEKGIKVEAEHTTDKAAAKEIAMDHLFEDPKYYDKLSKIDEGTCGYNADVKTGKEFKTPGGIKMKKDPYGLSAFAIELVKEFNNDVNEVGELSSTPYDYVKRSDDLELDGNELFGTVVYDFSAGSVFYDVIFEYDYDSELGKNIVKVDFTADESYEMTNTNEPYKIMATIFSIIKKELANNIVKDNLDILLYTPAETKTKGGEAVRLRGINQRNELYKAFFKKNIPHVKMEETPNETRFYLKENQLNEAVRCKALHNTPQNELIPYIKSLTQFMDSDIEIRPLPKVKFVDDESNASKVLGKTAYYDPQNCAITLYITDRHPKDILRSFAHEMIHHMQNMQGRLGNIGTQNVNQDDNLKGLEEEAYQLGNILLRSWENSQDQLDEIKLQPKNTGVGSKLKVNFKLDPSYFKYSKDINSLDDVDEKMFGGWVTSKDLPEIQGMLYRDKSSNIIINIVTDLDDNKNIKVWKDKLTKLEIPHTDKHFNSKNHGLKIYGISDINVNKYIDLKFEQPTNEIKVQPKNTGIINTLTSEEKKWIDRELWNTDRDHYRDRHPSAEDPDVPLDHILADGPSIDVDIMDDYRDPKELEIFNSIHRKLKNKVYTFNYKNDSKMKKYPEDYDLRDTVVGAEYDDGIPVLYVLYSGFPFGEPSNTYGAFDKDTGEYLKYSDLDKIGKVDEIKVQPKKTGIKGKINLEFFPNDLKIKSYSDILNFLSTAPKSFIPGVIKLKDFPLMFAEIFINSKGEISMDLEANSNHPERYDIWVQRLKDLGIPFNMNHPYIDNINVEKNFNIEVNPIS